jgi:hypothetical protein
MSKSSFGFGSQDPFSDLLGRFFGTSPASSPTAVHRVPIGRLLTDSARELPAQASARAEQDGSAASAEPGVTPSAKRVLLGARSCRRVEAQGLELEVTGAAKKLVELGYQPEFGARPLRRTLQTELDNRLATLLLDGSTRQGDTIVADVGRDGQLRVALAGTTVNEAASEEA